MIVSRKKSNNTQQDVSQTQNDANVFDVNIKTYLDEAIETLHILESKGINIYNKGRYGGMYLKKSANTNNIMSDQIKQLFQK